MQDALGSHISDNHDAMERIICGTYLIHTNTSMPDQLEHDIVELGALRKMNEAFIRAQERESETLNNMRLLLVDYTRSQDGKRSAHPVYV